MQRRAAEAAERVGFLMLEAKALAEMKALYRLSSRELQGRISDLQRESSDPALGVVLQHADAELDLAKLSKAPRWRCLLLLFRAWLWREIVQCATAGAPTSGPTWLQAWLGGASATRPSAELCVAGEAAVGDEQGDDVADAAFMRRHLS